VLALVQKYKFMRDNIVRQADGQLKQLPVQIDDPVPTARSPANTQLTHFHAAGLAACASRESVAPSPQPVRAGGDIPIPEMRLGGLRVTAQGELCAIELERMLLALDKLEPVTPAQIRECLAGNVLRGAQWWPTR